jgi:calcineurin-like phosphoesterase family protein
MLGRSFLIAALVVAGLGLVALLFAEEKTEDVAISQTGATAQDEDEWIGSVPGNRARVWAIGDADPPASKKVARLIRRGDPDRILYLGDVYPTGTREDFTRWAKPFGRLVKKMAPTPGNHDFKNARDGYDPFWREVTGEFPHSRYSFKAGGWEILSVNNEDPDWRPQRDYLERKVLPGGNCRIAFWHRPRYNAGKHEEGGELPQVAEFWDAIVGRARLIVNGHDHNSQRMRETDGIVQLIAGAGGRRLYDVNERHRRLAFSNDKKFAALRLDLEPGRARWRFVAVDGKVLDKGSLRCRA